MFESPIVILFTIIVVGVLIVLFFKTFSNLSFDSIDSYTSYSALIKKLRVFSILSMVLIPIVAYYESEYLKLYLANWPLLGLISFTSLISFIISFYKKLTTQFISIVLGTLFVIVVSLIYIIAFQKELNSTIIVEASILLLLSKAIFPKLKHIIFFLIYIYVFLGVLVLGFSPEINSLNVLISTTLLSTLVAGSIVLVEGSSVNNLAFANKMLKNSNLFVLVSDQAGKIVYMSEPLLQITGKVEKELLGYGWWNYREKKGHEKIKVKTMIRRVLQEKSTPKYTNQLDTLNGVLDIEWSDFALEGKFVMSIGTDVTKQLKYRKEIEMLSLVATSVTNGVSIMDSNYRLIWNNDQLKELLGLSGKDIVGKDIIQMLVPLDADKGVFIKNMSQIEPNVSQTVKFKNTKGEDKFVMLTNSVVTHPDGSVRKRILVWTDVSEQWKIEKRYKEIINNAFDTIYTISPKGIFTYVNKQMESTLNLSNEEIIGKHYIELIDESYRTEALEFYQKQILTKEPYSYFEFKMATTDGSDLWVGQNVRVIVDDTSEKKIVELHAVARDITESKIIREELQKLSYVASNTGSIVIIIKSNFDTEWVNEAFETTFGYTLEEVKGKNLGDILNGKNTSQETLNRIVDKLAKREHVNEELINYDKAGNERWIEVSMDPIFDSNNEVINYIAVESDITERKSQELLIKEQHESIIDSLNYASIIQSATLPSQKEIDSINPNVEIYYRPKEIIGGDFYLVETVTNEKGNLIDVYVVADCTGHGVPGAMLSVLCTSIIKEAIRNSKVQNSADALNYTRKKLAEILRANEDYSLSDGMDLSMCVVDSFDKTIDYSGANRPLFIYRKEQGVIEIIKGDKQSVGHNHAMQDFTYSRHYFKEGDSLYLFSDGIIDQFGGPKFKKFMTSRLKQSILNVAGLPIKDQIETIKDEVLEWQGDTEQTDDVCLMGIQV